MLLSVPANFPFCGKTRGLHRSTIVMSVKSLLFSADDFALFERYERSVSYADVSLDDKSRFDSLRSRLKGFASEAAANFTGRTQMKGFVSIKNPSGRTPKSLWCCIYPAQAPNKSFGMQVALIVSKNGVEISLCLGSGGAELRDAEALGRYQEEFRRVQQKLAEIPDELIVDTASSLSSEYYWRKQWRLDDRINDVPDLRSWLEYASSPAGKSAGVSMYFTPQQAIEDPGRVVLAFLQTSSKFARLVDFVYADDMILELVDDPFDILHQLNNMQTQPGKPFKPGILLCAFEAIATGELTENEILFDDLLPRFRFKMKEFGLDVSEKQAAYGFYYLGTEPFWELRDVQSDSPKGVREGFARFPEDDWQALQNPNYLKQAILVLELAIGTILRGGPSGEFVTAPPQLSSEALVTLRKHLQTFKNSKEYSECVPFRDEVYERYRKVFSSDNIGNLDRDDFENFLKYENNHHWTGINRWATRQTADMKLLRESLGVLLDSTLTLAERYDGARSVIRGFGRAVLTPILHISEPAKFAIWNGVSNTVLQKVGFANVSAERRDDGQAYEIVNAKLLYLSKELQIDLWELDAFMDYLAKRIFKLPDEGMPDETDDLPETELYSEPSFEQIFEQLTKRGLKISARALRQYHASLKSRKFVILAGLSGTGKTMLAQYYADAVGASCLLVPVAPNWTSNEDLLGYNNPLRSDLSYQHTETSKFLIDAEQSHRRAGSTARPYHLILDEMNLARVEHYFAKFLSLMEVRSRDGEARMELGHNEQLTLGPNVYVIGTVNVDETTKDFSDKVFDRAQTIRLDIRREDIEDYVGDVEYKQAIMDIWDAVRPVAPFAYRVIDDMKAYISVTQSCGGSLEEALDDQVLQKVLPKIRSADGVTTKVLEDLVEVVLNLNLKESAKKAQRMLAGAKNHGFPDFFS